MFFIVQLLPELRDAGPLQPTRIQTKVHIPFITLSFCYRIEIFLFYQSLFTNIFYLSDTVKEHQRFLPPALLIPQEISMLKCESLTVTASYLILHTDMQTLNNCNVRYFVISS